MHSHLQIEMVGRRQLREHALKALYANSKNPIEFDILYQNSLNSLEKIYPLYVYQLNLILALKEQAQEKIERSKNKNLKTEEDLNPNLKFVENQIFDKLENNKVLNAYTDKHSELLWKENNQYPQAIFKRMTNGVLYQNYMDNPTQNFEQDKEFIQKLFDKYIAKNESLIDHYEEKYMDWADDFHIANSMTYKTLKFIEKDRDFQTLLAIFKSDEDKIFLKTLLETVLNHTENLNSEIESRLVNWELDRIAEMDKLILQMGLAELIYHEDVPPRVVINEYIELAKTFSSPSSNVFINGILDNFVKDKQT